MKELFNFPMLALCLGLAVTFGCTNEQGPDSSAGVTTSDVDDSEPDDLQTADDSDMDPTAMLGQEVTIRGEVDEVYDAHTVRIDDNWDDSVVIVTKDPLPAELNEDGVDFSDFVVQATGTVAEYNLVEIEADTGWDLTPEVEAELEETERMLLGATVTIIDSDEIVE